MPVMWVRIWDDHRTSALIHMYLERVMFDFAESPFVSTMKTPLFGKN